MADAPTRSGRRRRSRGWLLAMVVGLLPLTSCRVPFGDNCEIWWGEPAIFDPGGALYTPNGSAILAIALALPIPVCGDQRYA